MKNIQIEGSLAQNIKEASSNFNTVSRFLLNLLAGAIVVVVQIFLHPIWLIGGMEKLVVAAIILSAGITYKQKKDEEKKKNKARGFLRDFVMTLKKENIYTNETALADVEVQTENYTSVSNYGPDRKTEDNFVCFLDLNGNPQILEERISVEERKVVCKSLDIYEQSDIENPEVIRNLVGHAKTFAIRRGRL